MIFFSGTTPKSGFCGYTTPGPFNEYKMMMSGQGLNYFLGFSWGNCDVVLSTLKP